MRGDGKGFSAPRGILSSRAAVSGSKPSRTRISKILSTEAPRWTLCATQSFQSCVISRCAMEMGQPAPWRVPSRKSGLAPGLVGSLDDAGELVPLLVLRQEVAVVLA